MIVEDSRHVSLPAPVGKHLQGCVKNTSRDASANPRELGMLGCRLKPLKSRGRAQRVPLARRKAKVTNEMQ